MGYRVVVVGATGNVGREMLNILAERAFPVDEIVALASRRSLGTEISFGDRTLKTRDLDTFDFTGWDIALFAQPETLTFDPALRAAFMSWLDQVYYPRFSPGPPPEADLAAFATKLAQARAAPLSPRLPLG